MKNLENVQGDERGTVIFSIGYARDSKGVMYMNFGPLSREGGYRRLNVAITRAKYNVKLVGSIVPADIDLDKTSSEGVKMLRSYMEFAQRGISALENEMMFDGKLNFDSPFEESVHDFLVSKGYDVVTQVGCSGFRIDMVIKNPVKAGKFALGIECDGATYHGARTVRERDRLRQEILESMGWRIYRIWSTDWVKDFKSEEDRLLAAIEASIKGNQNECMDASERKPSITHDIVIEEKVESLENTNRFGFEEYRICNPDEYMHVRPPKALKKIIEIEQPIHFDELCRKMAPLYGRQKVSPVVREEIGTLLAVNLRNCIENKDSFISFKDFKDLKVRVPRDGSEYFRPINYICDDELLLAMMAIVQNSFGITPEDLFIVTAREFGYKRTGENILSILRRVYETGVASKKLKEVDGKVSLG